MPSRISFTRSTLDPSMPGDSSGPAPLEDHPPPLRSIQCFLHRWLLVSGSHWTPSVTPQPEKVHQRSIMTASAGVRLSQMGQSRQDRPLWPARSAVSHVDGTPELRERD